MSGGESGGIWVIKKTFGGRLYKLFFYIVGIQSSII